MRVGFFRETGGVRNLGEFALESVPRAGDTVVLPGRDPMVAWGVAWRLDGGEPVAQVELMTVQERDRRIGR